MAWPSGRLATAGAVTGVAFMAASGFVMFLAAGASAAILNDPGSLVSRGPAAADVLRWSSLLDLLGYLSLALPVFYLRKRLEGSRFIDLYSFAGLAYVLIGAAGAVTLGVAGPPLMRGYASASAPLREAITSDFSTLYLVVFHGLWQTLEGIPAAVWLLGAGSGLLSTARRLGILLIVFGCVFALVSAGRLLSP